MVTAIEFRGIMESRKNFYQFLSRMFEKELTTELITKLKNTSCPTHCEQQQMQEGYHLLTHYFSTNKEESLEEELAADYAKVFLAAGESNGKAAFPYESVYTSKEGLVMQEAWLQVKEIYHTKGLGLSTTMADIKEDHIAMELLYMSILCKEATLDTRHTCIQEQLEFLETHLLNWVPSFGCDITNYARTDFYKAIGLLTVGYLQYDLQLLKELIADASSSEENSFQITTDTMDEILKSLKDTYKIYAPKFLEKQGPKGKGMVRYKEINSIKDITNDRHSDFSAKEIYYPIIQTMLYFKEDSCETSTLKDDKDILLFLHPCDINALHRLDTIFLKNGGQEDLYYKRLRDKVKIVLLECKESYENCFCVSMGSNKTNEYDLAIRIKEDSCQVQVKDNAFTSYFTGETACTFTPEFVMENEKKVSLPIIKDTETLKVAGTLKFWEQFDNKCIGCGGCNTVCPTCSCFDTVDVIYDETSHDGERRRVWSSCMLNSFTMTAGGNRARKTAGANMRFKTLHKIHDYKKRFGGDENMCVGCGRCVTQCPEKISFIDTLNQFHTELEQAKLTEGEQ